MLERDHLDRDDRFESLVERFEDLPVGTLAELPDEAVARRRRCLDTRRGGGEDVTPRALERRGGRLGGGVARTRLLRQAAGDERFYVARRVGDAGGLERHRSRVELLSTDDERVVVVEGVLPREREEDQDADAIEIRLRGNVITAPGLG